MRSGRCLPTRGRAYRRFLRRSAAPPASSTQATELPPELPARALSLRIARCARSAERGAAIPCATHALLASAPSDAQHPAHFQAPPSEAALDPAAPPRAPPFLS